MRCEVLPTISLPTAVRRRSPITTTSGPVSVATAITPSAGSVPASSCRTSTGTPASANRAATASRFCSADTGESTSAAGRVTLTTTAPVSRRRASSMAAASAASPSGVRM